MNKNLKKIKNILTKEELGYLPASLTYYFVLAIIPILTLTVLIASSFNISLRTCSAKFIMINIFYLRMIHCNCKGIFLQHLLSFKFI